MRTFHIVPVVGAAFDVTTAADCPSVLDIKLAITDASNIPITQIGLTRAACRKDLGNAERVGAGDVDLVMTTHLSAGCSMRMKMKLAKLFRCCM